VRRNLKLPGYVGGFELDLSKIVDSYSLSPHYTPLSSYPKVVQDITLKLNSQTPYHDLFDQLNDSLNELKPKDCSFSLEPVDIYQKEDDAKQKNISLRLTISSYERTLTDKHVNELLNKVAEHTKAQLGATRV
jgi:phenylalanyl-tRNA synthetase beta subunit